MLETWIEIIIALDQGAQKSDYLHRFDGIFQVEVIFSSAVKK